ncbi:MAG: hypothetical protein RI964_2827 [Pseudomonadota bacterium]|jgi:hemerythrin-like domain-containing protein
MHKIMTELHQDHVNLARLLTLLDQQVDILAAGDEADLLLITDIADYIRRYSDQIHHPKEDEVYKVFCDHSDAAANVVAALLTEHQHLPNATLEFQKLIDGVINGDAIISRQDLQDKIVQFIALEKAHINTEEASLFPLINNTLQADHWARVESDMLEHTDPLFGAKVLERYQTLYQLISS